MKLLLVVIVCIAGVYQLIAIAACIWHLLRRRSAISEFLPISILKPVRGADPGFYDAIRSHAVQQYPEFEILFGVRDPSDSAVPDIARLVNEFPHLTIRLIVCDQEAPNGKVGVLMDLAKEARHPILIVNDSDISVPAGYLSDVTAPLSDPGIGLVTCLYRAEAQDWPSRFEALAITTEFAPSTLVAPMFGVSEFGLGSTLAFRRADLERSGGFRAIADYLADDYRLGCNLHALGMRNVISKTVVSTHIAAGSWRVAWQHQLRWSRTIRVSRGAGYAGLPVTFATLWVLVAALAGQCQFALILLALRMAMALTSGWFVLRSSNILRDCYAIPIRDLWGVAVWASGLFGNTVEWRDRSLRLDREGKIIEAKPRR